MNRRGFFASLLALPAIGATCATREFRQTYTIDPQGADVKRVLALVSEAMERAHERAMREMLAVMRRNGFRLT